MLFWKDPVVYKSTQTGSLRLGRNHKGWVSAGSAPRRRCQGPPDDNINKWRSQQVH